MRDVALQESMRIHQAVRRAPGAADDPGEIDLRRESGDLTAIDQPARNAEPVLELDVRAELGQVGFVVEQEEVSAAAQPDRLVHLFRKALHRRDARLRQLDVHRGRELVTDAARVEAGGAESEHLGALEDDDVRAAATGEMIGDARAHDAAADDHGVRRAF